MLEKNLKPIILILFLFVFPIYPQTENTNNFTNEFKIRTGVNISHWLSQSMNRGEERAKYITEADFDSIASAGFDHVRIPLDEVQLWDSIGNKHQDAFDLLHNAIGWALEKNLRVIVDLHIIRSFYFDAVSNPLWKNEADQDKLVHMWQQFSDELNQYPDSMVAYEILNEPTAKDPDDWNKVLSKVSKAIRIKEPNRIIVIGSNMWQNPGTFPQLKIPQNDKNIILSFHFYTPMALTHHMAHWTKTGEYTGPVNYPGFIVDTSNYAGLSEKAVKAMRDGANGYFTKDTLKKLMDPAIKAAKENNLPLYCGEYGVYPTIPLDLQLKWYKDVCAIFNENNIAYCHWGYKGDFPIVRKDGSLNRKLTSALTAK